MPSFTKFDVDFKKAYPPFSIRHFFVAYVLILIHSSDWDFNLI
jgi:hypothetical protein